MQFVFKAGAFEIEAWSGGHPMWVKIRHNGVEQTTGCGFHHNELKDLAYVVERMRASMRAALPESYRHEMD